MAENKKSFILYTDIIHTVRRLPKNKQADLFMAILEYVNDENPEVKDMVVGIAFEPIKHQLKRDLVRYENFKAKQAENGKMGGRPRKEETQIKPNNPSLLEESQKSLNVNDTVTDTVIVNEESNTHVLLNSNLFRKPNIPTLEDVKRVFKQHGGTDEMAIKFFANNESTEWYSKGSPIKDFSNLVPSYVASWKRNELKGKNNYTPPAGRTAKPIHEILDKYK